MEYQTLVQSFTPVFNKNSKILILGSFPSVLSRKNRFYYMNPQNRFWKVLDGIFNTSLYQSSKERKIEQLLQLNIALYDVIESCKIKGSSDSSIKDAIPLNINYFIQNTSITKIFLNGNTSYQLFIKAFPHLQPYCIQLPSTSSANAKFQLSDLIHIWSVIKDELITQNALPLKSLLSI